MKTIIISAWLLFVGLAGIHAQNCDEREIAKAYTYSSIHKALRDLVDDPGKAAYFNDEFFNSMLRRIVTDKHFTEVEKAQVFFLMQKKIGFAFTGVQYIPPTQNYFTSHTGKVYTYNKTRASLKDLHYDVTGLLRIADTSRRSHPVVAGNALLLATVLSADSTKQHLPRFLLIDSTYDIASSYIVFHYACVAASLVQSNGIAAALTSALSTSSVSSMCEDALCALYSHNSHVSIIQTFVNGVKDPSMSTAVQTAVSVLQARLPAASFQKTVKSLIAASHEKWKTELCQALLNGKIPYCYKLASRDLLVTKKWEGVLVTACPTGQFIRTGRVLDFDAN